jgi:hypothetical protein
VDRLDGALVVSVKVGSKVCLHLLDGDLRARREEQVIHMNWHKYLDTFASIHLYRVIVLKPIDVSTEWNFNARRRSPCLILQGPFSSLTTQRLDLNYRAVHPPPPNGSNLGLPDSRRVRCRYTTQPVSGGIICRGVDAYLVQYLHNFCQ